MISSSTGTVHQLTYLGLLLATFTFTLGMLEDMTSFAALNRLRRAVRFIAMPLEVTVTLSYWLVYFTNASLITDQRVMAPITIYEDIGLHLLPAILLVADYHSLPPKQTQQMRSNLAFVAFGCTLGLYCAWLTACYKKNGYWPYPILEEIGQEIKAILFVGTTIMMVESRAVVLNWSTKGNSRATI